MIDKGAVGSIYTSYEASCDECSTGWEQFQAIGWSDLINQMEENGWHKYKVGDKWHHVCPDCR